jgi:phosphopantetheinyl transferase
MQAIESETLILYQTDLRGQWPESAARALARRLPYLKRLAVSANTAAARASLAGTVLALRALGRVLGRGVDAGELLFAQGDKPRLRSPSGGADFSIAHSDFWVGCAALGRGQVGLDVEMGTTDRLKDWVVREALLKARGTGLKDLATLNDLVSDGGELRTRDEQWHVRHLQQFAGAAACVVSSVALAGIEARALPLAELFES